MRQNTNPQSKHATELVRANLGIWLRERRTALGLSQREIAELAGFEYYTFISQLETGRGRVPAERYESYAKALKVDAREFAMRMLQAYENSTYRLLFPTDAVSDLERRLSAIEAQVAK